MDGRDHPPPQGVTQHAGPLGVVLASRNRLDVPTSELRSRCLSFCRRFFLPGDRFWKALGLTVEGHLRGTSGALDAQQFGVGRQFRPDATHGLYNWRVPIK